MKEDTDTDIINMEFEVTEEFDCCKLDEGGGKPFWEDGLFVGWSDGWLEGLIEGREEGWLDGCEEGAIEGFTVDDKYIGNNIKLDSLTNTDGRVLLVSTLGTLDFDSGLFATGLGAKVTGSEGVKVGT